MNQRKLEGAWGRFGVKLSQGLAIPQDTQQDLLHCHTVLGEWIVGVASLRTAFEISERVMLASLRRPPIRLGKSFEFRILPLSFPDLGRRASDGRPHRNPIKSPRQLVDQ